MESTLQLFNGKQRNIHLTYSGNSLYNEKKLEIGGRMWAEGRECNILHIIRWKTAEMKDEVKEAEKRREL